jgi:hypothetical protein
MVVLPGPQTQAAQPASPPASPAAAIPHAGAPTAPAPTHQAQIGSVLNGIIDGLLQALHWRKVLFCALGIVGLGVAAFLFGMVAAGLFAKGRLVMGVSWIVVDGLIVLGLWGVLAGGLARLDLQRPGKERCGAAVRFCFRFFLPLFGETVTLLLALLVAFGAVNGLIYSLVASSNAGALIGALLFPLQLVVNILLALLLFTGFYLLPCATAVESIGFTAAWRRLLAMVLRRPGALLTQFALTTFVTFSLILILTFPLQVGFWATIATNGPSVTALGGKALTHLLPRMSVSARTDDQDASNTSFWDSGSSRQSSSARPASFGPHNGDYLRYGWIGACLLVVLAALWVFWICAYTRFYQLLHPGTTESSRE